MDQLFSESEPMTPTSSQYSDDKKVETVVVGEEKGVINQCPGVINETAPQAEARTVLNACIIVLTVTSSMIINVSPVTSPLRGIPDNTFLLFFD